MAKKKSIVKAKSAARSKIKKANVKASAGSPSKIKSAVRSKIKKANVKASEGSPSKANVNAAAIDPIPEASAISAALPLGQAIDAEQRALINSPEGANIFDKDIGFGVALPGETGEAAVMRIKEDRKKINKKAKVSNRSR